VQNLLTGLKLVLLVGLIVAGFMLGEGNPEFLAAGSPLWAGGRPGELGIALLLAMFAYSGWNGATYIAEEVEQPGRTLPRALLAGRSS
jgi:APA family basic amino acid/polyamine antiporter